MNYESLGDWCKWLERNFSPEVMIPTLPVIIRLDGNNFHNWTKGLSHPFDERMVSLMKETTKYLVKETNAVVGYCQSDEITLILYSDNKKVSIYNDGKKQKILSKLTAKCVNFFNEKRKEILPEHNKVAVFDCRIYQVPTLQDACNQLLWRELDATKNSIQSLARSLFPSKVVYGLNTSELQDKMMLDKNVNWNDLCNDFKRGSYFKNLKVKKPFTKKELEELPLKHNARNNPNLIIERSVMEQMDYPPLNSIQNKVNVLFFDEDVILKG